MNGERQRLDKWLWFARFIKTRSQAAALIAAGEVTVQGIVVTRVSHPLRPGAVVALPAGPRRRRAVRVVALGSRRGPAPEARALYEELPEPAPLDIAAY